MGELDSWMLHNKKPDHNGQMALTQLTVIFHSQVTKEGGCHLYDVSLPLWEYDVDSLRTGCQQQTGIFLGVGHTDS